MNVICELSGLIMSLFKILLKYNFSNEFLFSSGGSTLLVAEISNPGLVKLKLSVYGELHGKLNFLSHFIAVILV